MGEGFIMDKFKHLSALRRYRKRLLGKKFTIRWFLRNLSCEGRLKNGQINLAIEYLDNDIRAIKKKLGPEEQ